MGNTNMDCTLLNLPGEIRNQILRLALVESQMIPVDSNGLDEPELLQVCSQLRKEGISIFYAENIFRVQVRRSNSDILLKWSKRVSIIAPSRNIVVEAHISDRGFDWSNMLVWLRRWHAGEITTFRVPKPSDLEAGTLPGPKSDDETFAMMIGMMFELTEKLKGRGWTEVEGVLKEQHRVFARLHVDWQ